MKTCRPRQLLTVILVCSFSCSPLAEEAAPNPALAMLNVSGKVQVNGSAIPRSTALFSGDLIQTQSDSVANITVVGSSVLIRPNTLIEFQRDGVEIGQGGVVIATSRGMIARAYGLTISPGTETPSKFEVAENGDSVLVAAQQGNVNISDGKESSTVPEGQQTTKKKKKGAGAIPGASGSAFPTKTVVIVAGIAGAGAVAGILIANSGGGKKCISPTGDKKKCCSKDQHGNEKCQ
jgi:hypothetical protein